MKIDEPKTPYAKRYDPDEDEEEMRELDARLLVVDELDKAREGRTSKRTKEAEIPGLDIGEPEEDVGYAGKDESERIERSESAGGLGRSGSLKGEKTVVVDADAPDGKGHDGTVRHRDFEEMRKKHYEMKDIKGLLGYISPFPLSTLTNIRQTLSRRTRGHGRRRGWSTDSENQREAGQWSVNICIRLASRLTRRISQLLVRQYGRNLY